MPGRNWHWHNRRLRLLCRRTYGILLVAKAGGSFQNDCLILSCFSDTSPGRIQVPRNKSDRGLTADSEGGSIMRTVIIVLFAIIVFFKELLKCAK